ncbi:MAG TPA: DinB family protein [Methylophilaceae bacterium]|nr:DinB family protein [Methylophilaceae bacterium]HQR60989.1 DinB family protein [Methylophilaceae bacterium]
MDFKQYFLYQTDYQHWANNVMLGALDRLDDEARQSTLKIYSGTIHNSIDHLVFFHRKWLARLKGEQRATTYSCATHHDWRKLKENLRYELRQMQHWLERQPEDFFCSSLNYQRSRSGEQQGVWVRDALTHIYTYAATERGSISLAGSMLGAPLVDMAYFTYRQEMKGHVENMQKINPGSQLR